MYNDLSARLNRLAKQQQDGAEAEKEVQLTEQQRLQFLFANSQLEYNRIQLLLKARIDAVNPNLEGLPEFELLQGQHCVKQGNVAACLLYHQLFLNALPINIALSFGREPMGMYLGFSPEPERYNLHASVTKDGKGVIWTGDLGELSSEMLADFCLEHLTEYYLEQKELIEKRRRRS